MARRPGPLAAEHILDLSRTIAGAYCAKLLADLGATVTKVESPAGDPIRRLGPFPPGRDGDPEAGAVHLAYNSTKRSVVVDHGLIEDRDLLDGLIADASIIVADGLAEDLGRPGFDPITLHETNATLILTMVTPFGSDGPYRSYHADQLILSALGGWSYACGLPDREPLQAAGYTAETVAGAYAAVATVGAVIARHRHGHGDHVDVSAWEAAITCALAPNPVMYEYRGDTGARNSRLNTGPSFLIECGSGGYVGVNVLTESQWETMCLFIDRPDLLIDHRFHDAAGRTEHAEEIERAVTEALSHRDAEEVFLTAQEWRLPFGLVTSPLDALELTAHRERGYFVDVEQPGTGTIRSPRIPFLLPACPSLPFRAPTLGEHTVELRATAQADAIERPRRPAVPSTLTPVRPPLDGLRIVDFTQFQAGTMATLMAADLGAEVIKIEAIQRIDGWRGVGRSGSRPWETSGLFNWVNRNKLGITLNLADPRGAEIARSLVATAGAVTENYTPRVMGNLGLDFETLRGISPDLVMLSMPGFGLEGSWKDFAAFAWTTEELATICHLTGYQGGGPLFTGNTFGDPLAGLMGALALLCALHYRALTGEGQHIDLSQTESATSFVTDVLIGAQLTGHDPVRRGNRSDHAAPHQTYRCRDDRWIAISCTGDVEWEALARLVTDEGGDPPTCTTLAERLANIDAIDAAVANWTGQHDAFELMHRLQHHGVAAGVVATGPDLLDDAHLNARGFFISQPREELGGRRHPAEPFRFVNTPMREPVPAPYLGEHNHLVLCEMLGIDDATYAELERDQVIGNAPLL